jgi:hypothetical protein
MGLVADARSLTDRLERSHEERSQELAARRQAIADKLAQFDRQRTAEENAMRAALRAGVAARSRAVADTLEGFDEAFAATAKRQHAFLAAQTEHNRAQVSALLDNFHGERVQGEAALRAALSEGVAVRTKAVAGLLEDFDKNFAATAKRQHAFLTSATTRNRTQVRTLLGGFLGDRTETASIWRSYTARRAATGTKFVSAAKPPVVEVSVEHHPSVLEDKVFTFLAGHPNGVKVHDIERHFHASRAYVGRALHGLIEQNRARKDEFREIYFAS